MEQRRKDWRSIHGTVSGTVTRIEGDNYYCTLANGKMMIVHKKSARDIIGQPLEEQE